MLGKATPTNTYGSSNYDKQMGRLSQTTVTKSVNNDANTNITRQTQFSYYANGEACQIAGSSASTQIRGMLKSTTINGKVTSHCYNGFSQSVSN